MLIYMIVLSINRKYSPGQIFKFLFRGADIDVLQIQLNALSGIAVVYLFKLFFFKSYLDTHLWITALLSVYVTMAVFSLGFFSLFGAHPSFSIRDIRNLMRFNYNRKNKQKTIESMFEHLLEDADTETNPMDREQGGMGILIEKNIMNEVSYQRLGDMNQLTMKKTL